MIALTGLRSRSASRHIGREEIPIFEEAWNRRGKAALIEAVPESASVGTPA
jgi:hypothetical protein